MTKIKINPRANEVFRNEEVQMLYTEYSKRYGVNEHGIDKSGKIYFAFMNGNVQRFKREQFIKLSK